MDPLLDRISILIGRHSVPALPLRTIPAMLRDDGYGVLPREDVLAGLMVRRPDLFRILNPWKGPTGRLSGGRDPQMAPYAAALDRLGIAGGPWVIQTSCGPSAQDPDPVVRGARASLAHLGGCLDQHSPSAVVRWLGLLTELERFVARVRRERDPGVPRRPGRAPAYGRGRPGAPSPSRREASLAVPYSPSPLGRNRADHQPPTRSSASGARPAAPSPEPPTSVASGGVTT